MDEKQRIYLAIDLKSFYASVECVERNLNPLTTNLVVADLSRTEKTICLAVSPSLKAYGISGRARLFEVVQQVRGVNAQRKSRAPGRELEGKSWDDNDLKKNPKLAVDYIVASPRMALYMEYSTRIYQIYLKYLSAEDIHIYSIDEIMCDITDYLTLFGCSPRELASKMIQEVYEVTGITAAAGIGTNLYLCKIAMDIVAKKVKADKNGVRIAGLDEMSYRKLLWNHRPLTDFWRVGRGYAKKLETNGMFTMGDVARCSVGKPTDYYNEDLLYKLFGINAELLIDHAWGWEPCTIAQIKAYKPSTNSIGSGQVLQCPYSFEKARLVVQEMIDLLVLDMVSKGLVTNQVVLTVGYDIDNLSGKAANYKGEIKVDAYGRKVPKHAHGTANLDGYTSSTRKITEKTMQLFDRIVDKNLLVRRINMSVNHVLDKDQVKKEDEFQQMDLFSDYGLGQEGREAEKEALEREEKIQQAMLEIKSKYGKNAILKGMNLQEGATAADRNRQIGGHKA